MASYCEKIKKISHTKTNLNVPPSKWQRFSEWMHCICVVTFDLELGQAMEVCILTFCIINNNNRQLLKKFMILKKGGISTAYFLVGSRKNEYLLFGIS